MWFCICLVAVSLFAGVLLGDRYQPFQNGVREARLNSLEARMEMYERSIDRQMSATVDAGH